MAISILKNTHNLAVVKFAGTTLNDTLTLNTALRLATQIGGTPDATIVFVAWANSPGASDQVTITRGGTQILQLYQNGQLDFGGNGGFADNIGSGSDLVVTSVGTAQLYVTLRKSGYISSVEPEKFGSYDNPAVVGS
jgi:hypothetical protein